MAKADPKSDDARIARRLARRTRELLVRDDAVLREVSSNTANDPISFRRVMERLPLRKAATLAWMRAWSQRLHDEGESARADALEAAVTCPWLRRTPENRCDAACSACAGEVLALDR